ncbi:MAG: esterase-like activity of phytase family protein, partial [Alphaproteobacteria bacterium]
MRVLFAVPALFLLTTFIPPGRARPEPVPAVTFVSFEPVPLDRANPKRADVGALHFLGGWNIESNDPRVGGISAMHVEGGEVTALSDAGTIVRFPVPGGAREARAEVTRLTEGPGRSSSKTDRDTESLTVMGPFAWVGFEQLNAVWRYNRGKWTTSAGATPKGMAKWESNSGAEAMVRLPDGRFLIFSEGEDGERESPLLLFEGDPAVPGTRAVALRYRPPRGYRITDAALLPDGRLLLLNRRWRVLEGGSAKLVVASLGPVVEGREIADFHNPLSVDNMEALSVTHEGAETTVWIASDDNFN